MFSGIFRQEFGMLIINVDNSLILIIGSNPIRHMLEDSPVTEFMFWGRTLHDLDHVPVLIFFHMNRLEWEGIPFICFWKQLALPTFLYSPKLKLLQLYLCKKLQLYFNVCLDVLDRLNCRLGKALSYVHTALISGCSRNQFQ